jgi:hypothetical protein
MKKILTSIVLFFVLISTMAAATKPITLAWEPNAETDVGGYYFYYKPVYTSNWTTNTIVGRLTTNITVALDLTTVYQFYVTAYNTNALESEPSNQVRYQGYLVNGNKKPTALVLADPISTNFASYVLISLPTNGTITGTPPNIVFTPSPGFGIKDSFAYRSPELFEDMNITNYYSVYSIQAPGKLRVNQ